MWRNKNSGKPLSKDGFEPRRMGSKLPAEQGTAGERLHIIMPGLWSASQSIPKEYPTLNAAATDLIHMVQLCSSACSRYSRRWYCSIC